MLFRYGSLNTVFVLLVASVVGFIAYLGLHQTCDGSTFFLEKNQTKCGVTFQYTEGDNAYVEIEGDSRMLEMLETEISHKGENVLAIGLVSASEEAIALGVEGYTNQTQAILSGIIAGLMSFIVLTFYTYCVNKKEKIYSEKIRKNY